MTTIPLIENLVFEGGGAKGAAYAGCLPVLDHLGVYPHIRNIAGTSAGAITAALLATGGGTEGLTDAVKHTRFGKFISDPFGLIGDSVRFVKDYGVHTGRPFVKILKGYFKRFCGDANVTFAQLAKMADKDPVRFKRLTVVSSNIHQQTSVAFSAETFPSLPIWKAVRASMSIPFIFEPVEIDNEMYVDGGMAWNYPIDIYDEIKIDKTTGERIQIRNPKTLGFFLSDHHSQSVAPPPDRIRSVASFAIAIAEYLNETANRAHIHPDDRTRTVCIDDLGVSATVHRTVIRS